MNPKPNNVISKEVHDRNKNKALISMKKMADAARKSLSNVRLPPIVRLKKRITSTRMTGNDNDNLFSYHGTIYVGTPGQPLTVLFDTGSIRLWINGVAQCTSTPCLKYFDNSKSSTFIDLNSKAKDIKYGDGSTVIGKWINETVQVGDAILQKSTIQLATSFNNTSNVEEGIMGMGFSNYPEMTFWDEFRAQNPKASPVFSYFIDSSEINGGLTLGGMDTARYKGPLSWISVTPNRRNRFVHWQSDMNSIQVGKSLVQGGPSTAITAIFDTGTSLALFPHAIADKINHFIGARALTIGGDSTTYKGFNCANGKIPSNLPRIYLKLNGRYLQFTSKEYLFIQTDDKNSVVCISGVVGSDNNFAIIGNVFLRRYYISFDQDAKKMGFAVANRSPLVNSNFIGGSTAMQIEGAWNVSKGPSVWDVYLRSGNAPSSFASVDVTADHFNRYKSDLTYLKTLGANMYRFSISWSRILPNCNGAVNQAGIQYYSDMIDAIIANGAEPVATMYHWDLPQACHTQYGGWTNRRIVTDFTNYADVLLAAFSGKVKYWMTLNEPSNSCIYAYNLGYFAPNVRRGLEGQYLCGHYSILATAYVSQLMKRKYPGTLITLPLVMSYGAPLNTSSQNDIDAGIRSMEFTGGWFLDPLLKGDYPASMRSDAVISTLLPQFTAQDKDALNSGIDIVSINYYTSSYVYNDNTAGAVGRYSTTNVRNGVPIGPVSGISWQHLYPDGLDPLLRWVAARYPSYKIWLSEIGVAGLNEESKTLDQVLNDNDRISFYESHFRAANNALNIGNVPLECILVWSLLDNWEWQFGFGPRFGVVAVDYTNGTLDRHIKKSGYWLKDYFSYAVTINASNGTVRLGNNTNSDFKSGDSSMFSISGLLFWLAVGIPIFLF